MSGGGALQGRHALVTGGGRGIGAGIVRSLVAQGAKVSMLGRTAATLEALASELESAGAQTFCAAADVAKRESLDAAFAAARAKFGRIEILINNAGQAISAPITKRDDALWDRLLAVNLSGTYFGVQAALPDMIQGGFGRIVNIASTAGLTGYPYVAAYCAAKHGVIGLTRAVAREVAARNITVNAVCPGYTDTDLVREAAAKISAVTGRRPDEALQAMTKANPQGRLIRPDEVANAVLWLCLPGSESVTGQSILVAGGELM
ncbi:MAG TPA: SDR family NAD(P)-dependent oxidoreductase [Steroidobacteraceae bacterium]|jgi:NAD(P)-dependent dehydrogenase (short-subunit alcohol dehydrogenase family)|nr:SDR family NAD(P)-dependent oxidoreductase [Steroidobacteraceae bacterium]